MEKIEYHIETFTCSNIGKNVTIRKRMKYYVASSGSGPNLKIPEEMECDHSDQCSVAVKKSRGRITRDWSRCVHPEHGIME